MADNGVGIILIFAEEFLGAGECNLVDVFIDVLSGHSDAMVGDSEGAGFFVDFHFDAHFAEFSFVFAE